MRERTRLAGADRHDQAPARRDRRQCRADRDGRGREGRGHDRRRRGARCARRARSAPARRARGAAVRRGRRQRRLCRDQLRRRRHRSPGLGRHAAAHVHALGRARTATRSSWLEESAGEQAGIKSATLQVKGPQRLRLAEDRGRRAPAGAHLARSTRNARRHTVFASVWVYPVVDDTIEIEHQPGRRAHRHLPRLAARAASTSTRPTRPCA